MIYPLLIRLKPPYVFPTPFFLRIRGPGLGYPLLPLLAGGVATGPTVGAFGVRTRACMYNHFMDDLPVIAGYNDDDFYIMTFDIYIYIFIYLLVCVCAYVYVYAYVCIHVRKNMYINNYIYIT